jgi:long-chain acyl-CoA synthetase
MHTILKTLPSQRSKERPVTSAEGGPSPPPFRPFIEDELPLQRAYHWEKARANKIFLTQPLGGKVRHWTWVQTMDEARRMAAYLLAQNWESGSHIVILSKNCAWWVMAELAIWMSGHLTVPMYTSLTAQSTRKLIEHSEPVACFVGPIDDANVISQAIPADVRRIRFPNAAPCDGPSWESIVDATPPLSTNPVRSADDLATIIYTSGTTGSAKGVMHRFAAFAYFARAVYYVIGEDPGNRSISYLPLAHIAERALSETSALCGGWRIFFSENASTLVNDLRRARPTMFFSVPRLYIKFQQGVWARVPQQKLDRLLRIPILDWLVRKRVLQQLGLNTVRVAASGAAALPLDVLLWFRNLGLPLVEGYGTTETGITHVPPHGQGRPGYCGRGIPEVETKLGENNEVLVRSPMNMLAYYKDPEATRQAFTPDQFLRTGDIGELDGAGWLKITGRIKDQFKTTKGEYVSPGPIEMILSSHNAVDSCFVMGAGLSAPMAVILLSSEARKSCEDPDSRQALDQSLRILLDDTNRKLECHERLKFLVLVDSPWTIEKGFLTPTHKLKRAVLESYYSPFVAEWQAAKNPTVWHTER